VLGVTISRTVSVAQHVRAHTLFALRTIRHHGLSEDAIYAVYQAVVDAKLPYASPAWWGFSSVADRCRIEAFLRRSERFNFQAASAPSFDSICASADIILFNNTEYNKQHLLFPLLPYELDDHYF
jgi:hypothetical protein